MNTTNYTKENSGLEKMRDLLADIRVLMMATNLGKIPFSACPMTLQDMDEKGDLWFFTPKDSDHFNEIAKDNRVQLIGSNERTQTHVSIYGNATHIIDAAKVEQLWNPMLKAWFNGKEDENLALLNINMESVYYWNNDENKMISIYHLLQAAETGNRNVMGEKGHVNLQNH